MKQRFEVQEILIIEIRNAEFVSLEIKYSYMSRYLQK
jgi:hypothetical protein